MIGAISHKLMETHLKLGASRAFVLAACPTQGHEMLLVNRAFP